LEPPVNGEESDNAGSVSRFCRLCGREMNPGDLRYEVHIEVKAGVDTLVIGPEDLAADHAARIRALLDSCEGKTEEELMRDVYAEFNYDLCPACQKTYVRNPMPPGPAFQ
jgi:hypothetical protein